MHGDSEDRAVVLPFNILIEPFYSEDDIDSTYTTSKYDSTNHYYELYSDMLGNYKTIQSKIISFREKHKLRSITLTVQAEYDSDGSNALNGVDLYLILGTDEDGNEVIVSVKSGIPLHIRDYVGSDLDCDLNSDLYTQLDNYYYGDNLDADLDAELAGLKYEHKLKYKIVRTSDNKILIKKVIIMVNWEF